MGGCWTQLWGLGWLCGGSGLGGTVRWVEMAHLGSAGPAKLPGRIIKGMARLRAPPSAHPWDKQHLRAQQ